MIKDFRTISIFSCFVNIQPQSREFYHDRDVQDAELLPGRIISWVLGWLREARAAVLVVDVEEQGAIFQPLLPPAHQRDVF